jgi:hypothetical protein
VQEVVTKDEHAEKDETEDDGEKGPCIDVELAVGTFLGAHLAIELTQHGAECNRTFAQPWD